MSGPRIGLALGGGGARGFAHIPVLEALDELGVRPQRIAGTSIGAIMGAAYASGMSGADIRAYVLDTLGDQAKALGRLVALRPRPLKDLFEKRAIGSLQIDAERALDLFLPDTVAGDFSALKIPLTIVATDYYAWSECEIASGPLRPAIAASAALPMILKPVVIGGTVMVDGGITNPLPADKFADAELVIAVDVVGGPRPESGRDTPSPADTIFGATQILMQTIIAERLRHDRPDILIRPDISAYRVLDFLKVRQVLKSAEPVKDELKRKLETMLDAA